MTRESLERETYVVAKLKENKMQESDMKDGKERADLGYVLELKSIRIPRENEKRSQGLRERWGVGGDISILNQWLLTTDKEAMRKKMLV